MIQRLMEAKQRDIDGRIGARGLDPASFAYRIQASECVIQYIRRPSRVFGSRVPAEALALYPRGRDDLFITFEHDPHIGFRSSFRPAIRHEQSASVLTWEALMDILDQWLERLTRDTGMRAVRQGARGTHHGEAPRAVEKSPC